MVESTHKHRNIIDDVFDLSLALAAIVYIIWGDAINLNLTGEQWAEIAVAGATARVVLRRILTRIFGLGSGKPDDTEGASDGDDTKPSETPTVEVDESDKPSFDPPSTPPPPPVGGND